MKHKVNNKFNANEQFRLGYFDPEFYAFKYGFRLNIKNLKQHYRFIGQFLGYDPNPLFNSIWYKKTYMRKSLFKTKPLRHYLISGWENGNDPHPLFNSAWYLDNYPDLAAVKLDPLLHYLQFGLNENRCASGWFIPSECIDLNADFSNPYEALVGSFNSKPIGSVRGSHSNPSPIDYAKQNFKYES